MNLEINNDLQAYGIEVIASSNTNFDSELMKFIGGREILLPLVEVAKPLVFFIKNNSSKEVVGVSLRWNFVKPDGKTHIFPSGASSKGVLMGMKVRDPWMIGKTSLINSGDLRFFSHFGISQTIENMNKSIKYGRFEYNRTPEDIQRDISYVEYQKKWMEDVSGVSVSIDGIVFNDGTFVGEDKNFFFDSTNGWIQARRDFIKTLREGKLSGKSDTEILEQFISDVQERLPSTGEYVDERDAFEKSYKRHLNYLKQGVKRRRTKFSDNVLVNEYLETQDSDFITVQKNK